MKKLLLKAAWKIVKKMWKATEIKVHLSGDDLQIIMKTGETEVVHKTFDILGDGTVEFDD
jgi:hypothetical protein